MSATAIEKSGVRAAGSVPGRAKGLYFLSGTEDAQLSGNVLRELLGRGHEVVVALEDRKGVQGEITALLYELAAQHPGLEQRPLGPRRDLWRFPAGAIRHGLDYLSAPEPEQAGWALRALLFLPPFRGPSGRERLGRLLRRLEAGMPIPRPVKSTIKDEAPDVVLAASAPESVDTRTEILRAARVAGVPSVLVASPDAVAAVEGAASTEVAPTPEGRILRPLFWLLTPLLALVLPFLRPRATAEFLVRAPGRLSRRARKRARIRGKAKELEAKQARAREKAQIQVAKEAERERALAAKRESKAKARAADAAGAPTEAAGTPEQGRATSTELVKGKTRKPAKTGKGKKRPPFWQRKAMRGRVRAVKRGWKQTRRSVRRLYNRRYRPTYKSTIMRVPSRDELPALLNARRLTGRGAEIGVKQGRYSNELLSKWRGDELISIDPWLSADPDEYVDRSNVSQDAFEGYYQETRERLEPYGSRSSIWRMTSVEAAAKVADRSLDFAYIDARHDYASVKEDVEAWCTKVRPGGILAGHDYVDGDLPEGEFYVKSAVDEFFGARGIPVHGTEGPSAVESFPTWIVEVPEEGIAVTLAEPGNEEGGAPQAGETGQRSGPPGEGNGSAEKTGERSSV